MRTLSRMPLGDSNHLLQRKRDSDRSMSSFKRTPGQDWIRPETMYTRVQHARRHGLRLNS